MKQLMCKITIVLRFWAAFIWSIAVDQQGDF